MEVDAIVAHTSQTNGSSRQYQMNGFGLINGHTAHKIYVRFVLQDVIKRKTTAAFIKPRAIIIRFNGVLLGVKLYCNINTNERCVCTRIVCFVYALCCDVIGAVGGRMDGTARADIINCL